MKKTGWGNLSGFAAVQLASFVVALAYPVSANAQDQHTEPARQYRCISMHSVQRTTIVDDRTILFHMAGRKILEVKLTYTCHSLKFYGFFSYQSRTNQLCAGVDMIVSRSGNHCPIDSITDYQPDKPTASPDKH